MARKYQTDEPNKNEWEIETTYERAAVFLSELLREEPE